MGVAGSGKSTLGRLLADRLGWEFIEGDDHHPDGNVAKMRAGQPLDDDDRAPWLARLHALLADKAARAEPAVLACSALKASYRRTLRGDLADVRFVLQFAERELLAQRLAARRGHYFPPALLDRQLESLETPRDAIRVPADLDAARQADLVVDALGIDTANGSALRTRVLADGLAFPEAPRWRDGWLWFTDQHARTISRVSPDGAHEIVARTTDLPGGLGWLPDGSLIFVHMTERRLMRLTGDGAVPWVDLAALASFHCNDMLIDDNGRAYVGNFGYDLHGGAARRATQLVLVDTDGHPEVFAGRLVFPNGTALTADGRTLLVAESFGHRVTAFELDERGRARARHLWAGLGDMTPDGICLDADGALWIASPATNELAHVSAGGEVLQRCETRGTPYACMLGGDDRRTLFVCTSDSDSPDEAARLRTGRIEAVRVATPGVGLP